MDRRLHWVRWLRGDGSNPFRYTKIHLVREGSNRVLCKVGSVGAKAISIPVQDEKDPLKDLPEAARFDVCIWCKTAALYGDEVMEKKMELGQQRSENINIRVCSDPEWVNVGGELLRRTRSGEERPEC